MVKVGEIRQNIADEVKGIRNKIILKDILEFLKLVRRIYGGKDFSAIPENDWYKVRAIMELICCDSEKKAEEIKIIHRFIGAMLRD